MARVEIDRMRLRLRGVSPAQAQAMAREVGRALAAGPLEAGTTTAIPAIRLSLPASAGGASSLASQIAGGIRREAGKH
jgi:hypothetical protein